MKSKKSIAKRKQLKNMARPEQREINTCPGCGRELVGKEKACKECVGLNIVEN